MQLTVIYRSYYLQGCFSKICAIQLAELESDGRGHWVTIFHSADLNLFSFTLNVLTLDVEFFSI
jgi:hypothetical protein